MSTASEHRAWRGGNRPASISRPPAVPHNRSTVTSPTASGASTPNPATTTSTNPRHQTTANTNNTASSAESKPLATVKPAEQRPKVAPAPAPVGNFWTQRKAAQDQARASGSTTPKEGAVTSPVVEVGKKQESTGGGGGVVGQGTGKQGKVVDGTTDGFSSVEVQDFLKRGAYKVFRAETDSPKPASSTGRGVMANGQPFFANLSKQIAQLQAQK